MDKSSQINFALFLQLFLNNLISISQTLDHNLPKNKTSPLFEGYLQAVKYNFQYLHFYSFHFNTPRLRCYIQGRLKKEK